MSETYFRFRKFFGKSMKSMKYRYHAEKKSIHARCYVNAHNIEAEAGTCH